MSTLGEGVEGSLHRGFVGGRTARFLGAEVAKLADLARQQHNLEGEAARLCAEAMVATLLMSAWVKGRERVTVQIQASDPRFAFTADADSEAGLRARFTPHRLPRRQSTRPKGLSGLLHAIRSDVKKEVYRGITALDGRSLEDALAAHLRDSEQIEGFLRIGVELDEDGKVTFAGGLLVERLPEHSELPWLSSADFSSTYSALSEQSASDLLVGLAFGKIADQEIELLESRKAHWRCDCSMERIEAVLLQLGVGELTAMLEEDGQAEVTCHFCNVPYLVGSKRLGELILLHEPVGDA